MHSNNTWMIKMVIAAGCLMRAVRSACHASPSLLQNYTSITSDLLTVPAPIDVSSFSTYSISGHFKWIVPSTSDNHVLVSIYKDNQK